MYAFEQSARMFAESKMTLAGGVASTLRNVMKPIPLFLDRGLGARVWDVDGNEYIDYIMGYGPLILGHSHPELLERIYQGMRKGQQFGMQHRGEIELSKKIVELVPCADKVAFSGSGSEAVTLALRLARAHTGRQKVIRFEGHYHGWLDGIYTSFPIAGGTVSTGGIGASIAGTKGQSEHALKDIIIVPWNDPQALEEAIRKHGHEIAAVITEPVLCNSGCIKPLDGYMDLIRKLTTENGIVFILDEVITGYRVSPGGAQQRLGILPDLTTMGKAVAGGIQLSAVAGRNEIMDLIGNGVVSHLGTLNGNVVSTTAGLTTLDILNRDGGAAYRCMDRIAEQLVNGLRKMFTAKGISHVINDFGPVFHLMFTDLPEVKHFHQFTQRDAALYSRFAEIALHEGVALRPSGLWYISTAHTEQDIIDTLKRLERAIEQI